jgi:hypothetical protein
LLDQIIAINERHLKRVLCEYVSYHQEDRTHLGLGKGTPNCRSCAKASGRVLSHERLGGLHHRYDRAAWPIRLVRKCNAELYPYI